MTAVCCINLNNLSLKGFVFKVSKVYSTGNIVEASGPERGKCSKRVVNDSFGQAKLFEIIQSRMATCYTRAYLSKFNPFQTANSSPSLI